MEKNHEVNRSRRTRNQQSDNDREWNQTSDYNQNRNADQYDNSRSGSGLSPNYSGNYRPGDYGQYSQRNQGNRNTSSTNRNEGQNNRDNQGRFDRDWNDISNEGSYNARSGQSFPEDSRQNEFNQFGEAASRDWNRLGSPSYERGDFGNNNSRSEFGGSYNQRNSWRDNDQRNESGSSNQRNDYGNSGQSRNWWDKTKDEVASWTGDQNAQYRRDQDERGEHRGKGPKGYTRSDERIKEDVNERLTQHGQVDASEIEVEVRGGEVVLKGTVKSREEKRKTEDLVDSISGVKNVENRLKVENQTNASNTVSSYTNGLRERKGGLEYGPGAVSGMANTSSTGEFNTAQ